MNKAEDIEIFRRLQEASLRQNTSLTLAHKQFYIRLLCYAITHGEDVENGIAIKVFMRDVGEITDFSPRMSEIAIKNLVACGALKREKSLSRKEAFSTIFIKEFYEDNKRRKRNESI